MSSAPRSTLALDSGAIASHRIYNFRILPNGRQYSLDSFRLAGKPKKYITIGSSPNTDISIDDPAVSRSHCLLKQSRRGLLLQDGGSKNGTWVNGVRIDEYVLTPGTVFVVGATRILASGMSGKVRIVGSSVRSFVNNAYIIYGGSIRFTADALGVPRSTFSGWVRRKFRNDPEA